MNELCIGKGQSLLRHDALISLVALFHISFVKQAQKQIAVVVRMEEVDAATL